MPDGGSTEAIPVPCVPGGASALFYHTSLTSVKVPFYPLGSRDRTRARLSYARAAPEFLPVPLDARERKFIAIGFPWLLVIIRPPGAPGEE